MGPYLNSNSEIKWSVCFALELAICGANQEARKERFSPRNLRALVGEHLPPPHNHQLILHYY